MRYYTKCYVGSCITSKNLFLLFLAYSQYNFHTTYSPVYHVVTNVFKIGHDLYSCIASLCGRL